MFDVVCICSLTMTWSNTWTIYVKAALRPIRVLCKVWKAKLAKSMVCLSIMREGSYCFQRILAIAILSGCLSVCHTGALVKNGAS